MVAGSSAAPGYLSTYGAVMRDLAILTFLTHDGVCSLLDYQRKIFLVDLARVVGPSSAGAR